MWLRAFLNPFSIVVQGRLQCLNANLSKPVLLGQSCSDPFKLTGKHWRKQNQEYKEIFLFFPRQNKEKLLLEFLSYFFRQRVAL